MKLNANATFIKIPLAQIKETGNVRHEYDEDGIKELAESIRNNGLMNPITVKPAQEDENGEKTYELIAGHRRIRAYKYLCDQGDDFSMVECCIRTGNKLVLQIIENIQRADITPREKEDAIAEMLSENYSQADIARELSKPIQWVSDIVAGAKVRKIADEAGLNTENIATKTLSQLRSIPDNELTSYLERLVAMGGTTRAATSLLNEWKNSSLRQISEYTESLPTTHESSPAESEESDIDEQIEGMFKDEADDIEYNDDESMIEPTVMSEADFTVSELADEALKPTTHKSSNFETADVDSEKDRKETRFVVGTEIDKVGERFKPGTIISHAGKRLFFKDLYVNKEFVHATAKDSHMYLRVCKITRITDDYIEYTDGDRSCGKAGKKKDVIDSEIEPLIDSWLFDIPPDATMNLTTHASSENNELQTGGITSVQLRGVIYPTPTNAPVKILWEGQLYNVFAAEYDKTRGAVILAHDPFDVVEVQNMKPSAKTNRAQKIIRNCWQTYCRKNSERTAMGFYQFVLSQIGESN